MNRHQFLARLHARLRPRTYLEVGVNAGHSLTLSRARSIGIDPEFVLRREIQCDVHLARTSSDEFFARDQPLAHFGSETVDLAFVDGMHLAEYVVRDVLAIERFTHPSSVIVLDDVLPREPAEASRVRRTTGWTGDVFKAVDALRRHRPDLVVLEIDTTATGTAVVLRPDARRDGVFEGYDDWVESTVSADPQHVPAEVLDRSRAWDPEELLALTFWDELVAVRSDPPGPSWTQVGDLVHPLRGPGAQAR